MKGFWGGYAIVGFFASVTMHVLTLSGLPVPHETLVALIVAMFPVVGVAFLLHPRWRYDLEGPHVDFEDVRVPMWLHGVVLGSLGYAAVLWLGVPHHRFSLSADLDYAHLKIATWTPAIFYAAAFAMRWSARNYPLAP